MVPVRVTYPGIKSAAAIPLVEAAPTFCNGR